MLLVSIGKDLLNSFASFERDRVSFQIRNSFTCLIYDKVFRIGLLNPSEYEESGVVNIVQMDCNRLNWFIGVLHLSLGGTINLISSIAIGVYFFSWVFLILAALILLSLLPVSWTSSRFFEESFKWFSNKDRTIRFLRQILSSIRFIKMNAFENRALEKILVFRRVEMASQLGYLKYLALLIFLTSVCPGIAVFVFLVVLFKFGYTLEVEKISVFIKILAELVLLLDMMPSVLLLTSEMVISLRRIDKLLSCPEIDLSPIKNLEAPEEPLAHLEIKNAVFYWRESAANKLPTASTD